MVNTRCRDSSLCLMSLSLSLYVSLSLSLWLYLSLHLSLALFCDQLMPGLRMGGETPAENDAEIQIYVSCKESPLQRTDAASASYRNHLFVFIALLLSWCQSASANLIVLQSGGKVWMKLQVMLQQKWRHKLHNSTDFAPKNIKVFSTKIWFDEY